MQGQKVNYNLKQLMKKAWKKPQDYSTSTRVPASAAYPLEDDCTDVLLRVQHPSAEPAPGALPPALPLDTCCTHAKWHGRATARLTSAESKRATTSDAY